MFAKKGIISSSLVTGTVVAGMLILGGCSTANQPESAKTTETPAKVKNVIMMIGDGMGPQQMGLLETYARYAPHSIYHGETTADETPGRRRCAGYVSAQSKGRYRDRLRLLSHSAGIRCLRRLGNDRPG